MSVNTLTENIYKHHEWHSTGSFTEPQDAACCQRLDDEQVGGTPQRAAQLGITVTVALRCRQSSTSALLMKSKLLM